MSCILSGMDKFFTYTTVGSLLPVLPEAAVWSRLGRNRFLSELAPEMQVSIQLAMHQAFERIRPDTCGRWKLLPVASVDVDGVVLADDWRIKSPALAAFVDSAPTVWLGAVTVGYGIADLINEYKSNMTWQVVFDAVGSECADWAMRNLQQLAAQTLLRNNIILQKKRFSAGYGQVSLEHQERIFQELALDELQMSLSESFIMQPEKSVTAFAAVKIEQ